MKITPYEILKHLGFTVPVDGIEVSPEDVNYHITALELLGRTLSVDTIPDSSLHERHSGFLISSEESLAPGNDAEAERDRHAHAAQELRLVADQLREASASASALLSAEREARAGLEASLAKQSEELLKQQQQFEATSRRAIQEIDAARQEKRRDVERLQSELKSAVASQGELAQLLASAKEDAAAAHALIAELRAQVLLLRQEQAADRKHGKKGRLVPSKLRRSG